MKALVFPAEGDQVYTTEIDTSLTILQGMVGGYLEAIYGPGWHAYVNEEGKWMGLPVNLPATQFALANGCNLMGDHLVGNVVFLGGNGMDEADVPDQVVRLAETLYGPVAQQ